VHLGCYTVLLLQLLLVLLLLQHHSMWFKLDQNRVSIPFFADADHSLSLFKL
jgi:hypothetical protein